MSENVAMCSRPLSSKGRSNVPSSAACPSTPKENTVTLGVVYGAVVKLLARARLAIFQKTFYAAPTTHIILTRCCRAGIPWKALIGPPGVDLAPQAGASSALRADLPQSPALRRSPAIIAAASAPRHTKLASPRPTSSRRAATGKNQRLLRWTVQRGGGIIQCCLDPQANRSGRLKSPI